MFGADDLGLDLGTSTLTIVMRRKGVVLSEPCCVAYERLSRQVLAIGEEAARMAGRTPRNIIVERPFREGWVHSFDLVSDMLRHADVLEKAQKAAKQVLENDPALNAPEDRGLKEKVIAMFGEHLSLDL